MTRDHGMSGQTRKRYGVTVTARNTDGALRTLVHEHEGVERGLRAICAELDADGGSWVIVSVSTPATIWRDLQGTRERDAGGGSFGAEGTSPAHHLASVEAILLGSIGRSDLLAPEALSKVGWPHAEL